MIFVTKEELINEIKNINETDLSLRKRINNVRNTLRPRIELLEQNIISNVNVATNQSIDGIKTFVLSPIVPDVLDNDNESKAINKKYCDKKINEIIDGAPGTLNTLNELSIALNGDATFANTIITQLSKKANANAVVDLTSDQPINGKKTFNDNVDVISLNNISASTLGYVDVTSSIQTQLNNKANNNTVVNLSENQTITGNKTFSGITTMSGTTTLSNVVMNKIFEVIQPLALNNNTITINFSTATGNLFSFTPSNANVTLNITNIPTTANRSITLNFIINTSSNKFRINTLNINGISQPLHYVNGENSLPSIASASRVLQPITIIIGSTPVINYVFSNICPLFS